MALPIEFITRTRALLGEEYDKLEAALQADVPVSIRINRNKGTKAPKGSTDGWTYHPVRHKGPGISPVR